MNAISTDWSVTRRPHKDAIRTLALTGYHQRHAAVFLPGWSEPSQTAGLCIRRGLDLTDVAPEVTTLDVTKPFYGAEHDRLLYPKVKQSLDELGLADLRLHRGGVHSLKLKHTVDFAFLDLCGTLDEKVCLWLRDELQSRLVQESALALTVSYAIRASAFMAKAKIVYEQHFPECVKFAKQHYGLQSWQRLIPLLLVRSSLHELNFRLSERNLYRDTVGMLFYKFDSFTPVVASSPADHWPKLDTILALMRDVVLVKTGRRYSKEKPRVSSIITDPAPSPEPVLALEKTESSNGTVRLNDLRHQLLTDHGLDIDFDLVANNWLLVNPRNKAIIRSYPSLCELQSNLS
jgi:hypothetical protein